MSKIEVWARPLRDVMGLFDVGHLYFLYTDDNGQQWSVSAGPTGIPIGTTNYRVHTGEFEEGSFDYPRPGEDHALLRTISEGSGSAQMWLDIHQRFNGIAVRNNY